MVLDGQQRLLSLLAFLTNKTKLGKSVQEKYKSKFYEDLDEKDKRRLNDSIIHATVIDKQESPEGYGSIYHIFERLNSGGKILTPQQIRMALHNGKFAQLLIELNKNEFWRQLLHRKNAVPSLKDMELILRFFALFFNLDRYKNSMKNFLNDFMQEHQKINEIDMEEYKILFSDTAKFIYQLGGGNAFCDNGTTPKAAIVDSLMYGIAKRLQDNEQPPDEQKFIIARNYILKTPEYKDAINARTANIHQVKTRLRLSEDAFKSI